MKIVENNLVNVGMLRKLVQETTGYKNVNR